MGITSVNYSAYSKQKAMAYAAYMITGSAFKKVETNLAAVSSFKLHYCEMKPEMQYEYEEEADGLTSALGRLFLDNISGMKCKMHIRKEGEDLILIFSTEGFEEVICKIDKKGQLDIRAVPV